MKTKQSHRVSFEKFHKVLQFTHQMRKKEISSFMATAKQEGNIISVATKFVSDRKKESLETFEDMWKKTSEELETCVKPMDSAVFDHFLDEKNEDANLLGADVLERMEDLRVAFKKLISLVHLSSFFSECPTAFGRCARLGDWSTLESMLKVMENEWKEFADFEFTLDTAKVKISHTIFSQLKHNAFGAVIEGMDRKPTKEQRSEMSKRWGLYEEFILEPLEIFLDFKAKFVESYFGLFDVGLVFSMINAVKDKKSGELICKKMINWKTPESLLLEDPFRAMFPPVVCADRKLSCKHQAPAKSLYPEFNSVEEARNAPLELREKLSCRNHPGKLLLLLIRLNLPEVVKFAIENGLSVDLKSDSGQCYRLKWKLETEKQGRESLARALGDKSGVSDMETSIAQNKADEFFSELQSKETEKKLLTAEYSDVTPLSVAVENAVYGARTTIVKLLLREGANPLFCSDRAVKSCVNAISLLTSNIGEEAKQIPYLEDMEGVPKPEGMVLALKRKEKAQRKKARSKRRDGSVVDSWLCPENAQMPKKAPRKAQQIPSAESNTSQDSKGSQSTTSSARRRKGRKYLNKVKSFRKQPTVKELLDAGKSSVVKERYGALEKKRKPKKIKVKALPETRLKEPTKSCMVRRREIKVDMELRKKDQSAPTKENVARKRANKCLKLMVNLVQEQYQRVKNNHATKVLLYQACVEQRKEAIDCLLCTKHLDSLHSAETSNATLQQLYSENDGTATVTTWSLADSEVKKKNMGMDMFEVLVNVIDLLLNDGLQRIYPSYAITLNPILYVMQEYEIYLNNWRFLQLFRIIKLAMSENLAGDRKVILNFVKLPQVLHYLGLQFDEKWESRRWENLDLKRSLRAKLRIERPTEKLPANLPDFEPRKAEIAGRGTATTAENNAKIEKLLRFATKIESLDIIKALFDAGAKASLKTKYQMIAMTVKSQNIEIFEYVHNKFQIEALLSKSFIIALKGKYHQSMRKIFELGFEIQLGGNQNVTSLKNLRVDSVYSGSTGDGKNRQTLSLFSKCLEDVLFERTVFDRDDGRKNKENFTRQDEEETFKLLLEFLTNPQKIPKKYVARIIDKILQRSIDEYDSRIWFYGLHEVLVQIAKNRRYDLVTEKFIQVYKLNYGQWLMYSRELEASFKQKKKLKELREKNRLRSRFRFARKKLSSGSTDDSDGSLNLDSEQSFNDFVSKVKSSLMEVLSHSDSSSRIQELEDCLENVRFVVNSTHTLERTPKTLVKRHCRRHGSRNYDYLSFHDLEHGESGAL